MRDEWNERIKRHQEAMRRRERVLFAISVWGPTAIFDHAEIVRWMAKHDAIGFAQVKVALREAGLLRHEIEDLFGRHSRDCACWHCITRLHMQIFRGWAIRAAAEEDAI